MSSSIFVGIRNIIANWMNTVGDNDWNGRKIALFLSEWDNDVTFPFIYKYRYDNIHKISEANKSMICSNKIE